jgi:hypothetical protein
MTGVKKVRRNLDARLAYPYPASGINAQPY